MRRKSPSHSQACYLRRAEPTTVVAGTHQLELSSADAPLPLDEDATRKRWRYLVEVALPAAAPGRQWPVLFDHGFAWILLDVACGQPWRKCIPPPAWKNVPLPSLRKAIDYGESVHTGRLDLATLNERSLRLRGKR